VHPSHAPDIEFRSVTKMYGDVRAVDGVDLAVPRGAFVALLGPSGCGKTTCLRMIGGFEQPSGGEVRVRGLDMAGVPPFRRPVNMVFQHYALFPHLDVSDNIAYGLRQVRPRLPKAEIARKVDEALEMVRLTGYGRRRIHALSGGQQQRVALARALVNEPAVLLLDEPLAALDKKLRTDMQLELQNLQRALGITFILVTHDQEEALSMSDVVCVMNGGRIVQLGPPSEIYDSPADLFVADFVGKTNLIPGTVEGTDAGGLLVRLADGSMVTSRGTGKLAAGDAVSISVRPEAVRLNIEGAALRGTVRNRIFLGSTAEYAIEVPGLGTLHATSEHLAQTSHLMKPGEPVALDFVAGAPMAFPASQQSGKFRRRESHDKVVS
jgi:spermidine/putrescine transport system ATP-binding protein